MFRRSHFRIRQEASYPPFGMVVQAWYSPLLQEELQDDGGLSACLTLGVARVTQEIGPKKIKRDISDDVILAGCFVKAIEDMDSLQKHVKALSNDYLNHTLISKPTIRESHFIVVEANYNGGYDATQNLSSKRLVRNYKQFSGYNTLQGALNLAFPYIKKIGFTRMPDSEELRQVDYQVISMLLAYPSAESYAIASACAQAVLFLKQSNIFPPPK